MVGRFFSSIQGKLIGLYLVLIIGSLSTVTYLFYRTSQTILHASVTSHLQTVVQSRSELITRWMREREHDVKVLAKNDAVRHHVARLVAPAKEPGREQSRQALRTLLRLVRDQYGAYHEITMIDAAGRVLATTSPRKTRRPAPDAALLEAIRAGKRHITRARRYRGGRALSLEIAVPVEAANGRIDSAIVVHVDLGVVNQIAGSMRLMRSGEVFLVDDRGRFITHRDHRRIFKASGRRMDEVIAGKTDVGSYRSYQGVEVLGAYQWLPSWRFGLIAEVRRDEAFAPAYRARRDLFWIAGLVTAVVLLGTLLIARRIIRPLRELAHAVQAVAKGKLNQRLEIAGHDEIGYLTESFNQMAVNLEESRSEQDGRIRAATQDLARKNKELEEANRELQRTNHELEQQRALVVRSARLAAMGEMAAGIAHEINNPLTTIKNLFHSLREQLEGHGSHPRDLAVIEEEIDKINRLVLNFIRYARPPRATIAATNLRALAEKNLELLEPQIHQRQLSVSRSFDDDVPLVLADAEQVGQVLLNLLLNAIQASPAGGKLHIFIRNRFRRDEDGPRRVELGVGDSGSGIAPEERPKIFRPFFTTKSKGTGLGLAISQRIVEEHGGEISFSAGDGGVGTTFVVTLGAGEEVEDERDPDRG